MAREPGRQRGCWRDLSPAAEALLDLDGATDRPRPGARFVTRSRAGQRRARHHAAVRAAASSAVRMRRARRSGDDQRQPLERADRLTRTTTRWRAWLASPTRFLVGERPIARRVDDSVVRDGAFGPDDPAPLARLRARRRRHLADRAARAGARRRPQERHHARRRRTGVRQPARRRPRSPQRSRRIRADDSSISCRCTNWTGEMCSSSTTAPGVCVDHSALTQLPALETLAVQHHRAHVASVLAEHQAWGRRCSG